MDTSEFAKHTANIAADLVNNRVHDHSLLVVIKNAVLGYVLTRAPHLDSTILKSIVDNHCSHLELGKAGLRQGIAHIVEDCLAQEITAAIISDVNDLKPDMVYKFKIPIRGSVECTLLLKWLVTDLSAKRYTATETFKSGEFIYCFKHNNAWAITNSPDNYGATLFNPDKAVEAILSLAIIRDQHDKFLNSKGSGSYFNNYLLRGETHE
jgi:hypothetical protein